jgi:hypothetical protein
MATVRGCSAGFFFKVAESVGLKDCTGDVVPWWALRYHDGGTGGFFFGDCVSPSPKQTWAK